MSKNDEHANDASGINNMNIEKNCMNKKALFGRAFFTVTTYI